MTKICPECESTELSWALDAINRSGVGDGQLRSHDLSPALVLGCDKRSETVLVCFGVQDDLAEAGFSIVETSNQ